MGEVTIHAPLPDPFRFDDGRSVHTVADWDARREEIATRLLAVQYGTMPPAPEETRVETGSWEALPDGRRRRVDRLQFAPVRGAGRTVPLALTLTCPSGVELARSAERCPGHGTNGLPAVLYVGRKTHEAALSRGYVVVNYPNDMLEPMEIGQAIRGPARAAYAALVGDDAFSWGSIAAWAWGAHRAIDHMVSLPEIDAAQLAITGHSRNGKTALLAGALDPRCQLVNPAGSGCAGAGSYLVLGAGSEDLAALTNRERWWAWTAPGFEAFAGHEDTLPFDQHWLMALVAPRPLLRTEGTQDTWANPVGTSAAFLATQPVYDLLGAPEANTIHYRSGGHDHTEEDAGVFLDLCDATFFGKPMPNDPAHVLDGTPARERLFEWDAPRR